MTTYTYMTVAVHGHKAGKCVACGKEAYRARTFRNTVNPFNKNDDGSVKTRAEVLRHVDGLRREWESKPVYHARCES